MEEFKEITITDLYIFRNIEESEHKNNRICELHSGDVIYCNTKFMEKQSYYYELILGDIIHLHSNKDNILEEGIASRVINVFKKKTPDKKWWQFWIKQKEYVMGYNLEII